MINRFCRQRTKTRTFLCFKYFLSGYFEYQVHLNIYQNTKIDAYGQTIYSGINSPCNTCVVIEVEPIFSIHFVHLLSIDNTRLHQIWLKLDLLKCNILHYHYHYKCCLSLIIIVNLQQSIYCPVPGPWITGGQRGEGGIGTMEASL